ncbi:nucleoside kinase [bacterium]|nr:nucleoside kinase [bacterium]MBU1074196.1 nucleoside kinase [bacterium]MBU1674810.1 nucleoside kinase [bacterium]
MNDGTVDVTIEGRKVFTIPGSPLSEVLANHGLAADGNGDPVVIGVVNGQRTSLHEPLWGGENVGLMHLSHPKSHSTTERTLCSVLAMACDEMFPDNSLFIDFSYGGGMFCRLRRGTKVTAAELAGVEDRMRAIIERDLVFTPRMYGQRTLIRMLRDSTREYSRLAARHVLSGSATFNRVEGSRLLFQNLHLPSTGMLKSFALQLEPPGFVLLPGLAGDPSTPTAYLPQPKLFDTMLDYSRWTEHQGIADLGSINQLVEQARTKRLISICETRHEQALVAIAGRVAELSAQGRLVLIAGPSSSGKTTFAKRLALHLRVMRLKPFALSLDNYFVDRRHTPRDEGGNLDYETLEALRLELLNEHLSALLAGREVRLPRYDFSTGTSTLQSEPTRLEPGAPLIVEGIHALNPAMAEGVDRRQCLRVYVSALCHANIDDITYMPTRLTRLYRRIVRDAQFRGYTAGVTLQRWRSVREGEHKHIFPYQQNADVFFNTGLAYELGVLKMWAQPRLAAVPPEDPAYGSARALLDFLALHLPIDARLVPPTSLLREFIGGSSFSY